MVIGFYGILPAKLTPFNLELSLIPAHQTLGLD